MIRYTLSTWIVLFLSVALSACATTPKNKPIEMEMQVSEPEPKVSEPITLEPVPKPAVTIEAEPEPVAQPPVLRVEAPTETVSGAPPVVKLSQLEKNGMPPAPQILAAARVQLPPYPVTMKGTLKDRAANGHVRKTLMVDMTIDWRAEPPCAEYKMTDTKSGKFQTLEIKWVPGSPLFQWLENGQPGEAFDPDSEIHGLGVTWSDLSFGFMWSPDAETLGTGKKMGKLCWKISVPRDEGRSLLLWVEKATGRMLGAEERNSNGKRHKIIKVVSVKKFEDLWMIKDLDIIRPATGEKASLRISEVKANPEK